MAAFGAQLEYSHRIKCDREEERDRISDDSPGEKVPALGGERGFREVNRHAPLHWVVCGERELRPIISYTEPEPTCLHK